MGHNRNLADYAHHFDGTNIDLGSGNIETEGVVTYEDVTNVDAIGIVTARAGVKVPDNQNISLGTGNDFAITHDGTNTTFINDTGQIQIRNRADDQDIILQTDDGSGGVAVYLRCDGSSGQVDLNHYGSRKFYTSSTGATVNGTLVSDGVTSELDLSAISSSISGTAVDVFVYDTRKDSDGGAWRKRTQHTSWYNETLNTSTRGSRREFPAVAVIVLTGDTSTSQATIYDGDNPDLPMWMVIPDQSIDWANNNGAPTSIAALNGILSVTCKGSGIVRLNFVKDFRDIFYNSYYSFNNPTIVNRSDSSYSVGSSNGVIVHNHTNDIAMTVLPNAPIDDTTGLPVPTIAVATDGGTSIIKDDGTVIDITPYSDDYVAFDNNNLIIGRGDGSPIVYAGPMPNADISEVTWRGQSDVTYFGSSANIELYSSDYDPGNLTGVIKNAFSFDSSIGKVVKFDLNTTDANSTMVAYVTTSYNTGWMHGDIKGAFLSDTDTTNITNTTNNVVTNPNFASDSNWTKESGWSITSGVARWTQGGGSHGRLSQTITLTPGVNYVATVIVTDVASNGDVWLEVRDTNTTGTVRLQKNIGAGAAAGVYAYNFTAVASTSVVILHSYSQDTFDADDLYVYPAEEDRSVNNNGLQVFGTVTKSAVATGADLVAYGPFNNNNNFRQPYNSDLTFVQNDFSIMFWVYDTGVDQHCTLISRDEREFDISRLANAYGNKLRIYTRNFNGDLRAPDSASALPQNKWVCVCVVYTGGNTKKVYLDGVLDTTITGTNGEYEIDSTTYGLNIGVRYTGGTKNYSADGMKLALMRISGSAPSSEQVKKMYEDEKHLFQENAKATLYGSSDAVTALGYDEDTELLHVGTSSGRSDFQGLLRINNTTTAVTTAISASDELIAEQ